MQTKNVSFGLGQLLEKTPAAAAATAKVIFSVCALAILFTVSFTDLPPAIKLDVAKYAAATSLFMHGICQMFGLKVDNDPTIDSSKN